MAKYTLVADYREVTPEQARIWLESNHRNRAVSEAYVAKLASEIRGNRWEVNGESIKIASDGTLIDGQHRLSAIVRANTAITTLVASDLSTSQAIQYTTDVGMRRSLSNALTIRGEHNVTDLAGALNVLWRFVNGLMVTNQTPSIPAAFALLDEHSGMREAAKHASRLRKTFAFRPSLATWGIYTMSTVSGASLLMDDDDGIRFWEQLPNGVIEPAGTQTTDPLGHLRNAIQREKREARTRYSAPHMTALVIKTWNAYINGEEIKTLKWSPGGRGLRNPEPFPELVGQSELEDMGWFDPS